jgi:3-hydroxyisobutyrate dehydrogenase-like beta-hydroxyacid dehydrogenase
MVLKAANNLVTMLELVAAHESLRLVASGGVAAELLQQVMTQNGNLTIRCGGSSSSGAMARGNWEPRHSTSSRPGWAARHQGSRGRARHRGRDGLELPATAAASQLMMDVFLNRGSRGGDVT